MNWHGIGTHWITVWIGKLVHRWKAWLLLYVVDGRTTAGRGVVDHLTPQLRLVAGSVSMISNHARGLVAHSRPARSRLLLFDESRHQRWVTLQDS